MTITAKILMITMFVCVCSVAGAQTTRLTVNQTVIGDWTLQPIVRNEGQSERAIGFFATRVVDSGAEGSISAIWFRRPTTGTVGWQAFAWTTVVSDAEAFVGEVEGIESEGPIGFGGGGNAVAGLDGMMAYERGLLAGDPMLALLDQSNREAILQYLTSAGYPAAVVPFDLIPGVETTNDAVLNMLAGESEFLALHAADSVEGMADALRQREIAVQDLWPDDNIPYDGTEVWCLDRVITLTTFGCVNSHACTVSLGCWVEANVASPQSTWACEFLRQESHTLVRVLVSRRACSDGTVTQSEPFKECQTVAHRNRWVSRGLGSGFSSCSGPCNSECANPGLYPVEDRDFPGDWVPCTGC